VYESEGLWCEVRSVFLAPPFHVAPAAGGTETRLSTINDDRIHRVTDRNRLAAAPHTK
jgi:hypothetical protein